MRNFRVLLVEDDEVDARQITSVLKSKADNQISVTHVTSLKAATSCLKDNIDQYDVLLTDMHLEDSRGLKTVRKIRKGAKNRPIIVFSSLNSEELAIEAVAEGAQDYV